MSPAARLCLSVRCDTIIRAVPVEARAAENRYEATDGCHLRHHHHRRRTQRPDRGRLPARAGCKVLVLERRDLVGGTCVTEEVWPGFKVSTAAYVNSLLRPEIIRDLELKKHGFEMLPRNPSSFTPFPDGRYLMLGPDKELTHREICEVLDEGRRGPAALREDAGAHRRLPRADAGADAAGPLVVAPARSVALGKLGLEVPQPRAGRQARPSKS